MRLAVFVFALVLTINTFPGAARAQTTEGCVWENHPISRLTPLVRFAGFAPQPDGRIDGDDRSSARILLLQCAASRLSLVISRFPAGGTRDEEEHYFGVDGAFVGSASGLPPTVRGQFEEWLAVLSERFGGRMLPISYLIADDGPSHVTHTNPAIFVFAMEEQSGTMVLLRAQTTDGAIEDPIQTIAVGRIWSICGDHERHSSTQLFVCEPVRIYRPM